MSTPPRPCSQNVLSLGACIALSVCSFASLTDRSANAADLQWALTYQTETSPGSGRYHRLQRQEHWVPEQTAIIVCDMWDSHHCHRAVLRGVELAPRMNEVLKVARERGVTIIHAPSSCMGFYADHPARKRAEQTPRATSFPEEITKWCYKIPAEEQGIYPIDQTNGGEDDDPEEHAKWAAELTSQGRNPKAPWKRQMEQLTIDDTRDYITDKGDEVWSILTAKGIQNVMLMGVHTNMCVLGRPFGLRQMVRAGKNTALMSDMTDTMYDPNCSPYVSHFTGTDLIIDHIERHVCATVTSDQLLGGKAFRFKSDVRPTVAILMAEDEYKTETSLPPWSLNALGKKYRVRHIFGSDTKRNEIPGMEAIREADLLLVSVRRRPLPHDQLQIVREFVAAGKPMLGIRTASHAFSLRTGIPDAGLEQWPEFDSAVWGGHYTNHYGNNLTSIIDVAIDGKSHPVLKHWGSEPYKAGGSLYRTAPIASGTECLLTGKVPDQEAEPVAWTFKRADGGKSFYTSLGHLDDFQDPRFVSLLESAVDWLLE